MELSENLKLRLENLTGESQAERSARSVDPASGGEPEPIDEAESQMRKALGLLGEGQRHRSESERSEPAHRMGDRFNGGLHRRRFVQDGDIPVTVLRRDQGHELPAHRGAPAATPPTSSRLQRTEAALASESAARERAERTLADVQALAHDLQTKIGHAELAKNEAVEALRRERDVSAELRTELHGLQEQLEQVLAQSHTLEQASASWQDQLSDERHALRSAEKALRTAEAARDEAERLIRALSEEAPTPVARRSESLRRSHVEPEIVAPPARRLRVVEQPAAEPEPVKWWLNPKPAAKRR
jgi:hypothetical protein